MGKKAWEAARITVRSWVLQELLLCSGDVVPALQKPASPRMSSGRTLIALNDPVCLLTVERGLPVGAFSHLFVPRGGGVVAPGTAMASSASAWEFLGAITLRSPMCGSRAPGK